VLEPRDLLARQHRRFLWFLFARARDNSTALAASASYPGISTFSPRSAAISSVRSMGNPYVSYSLNASAPAMVLFVAAPATCSNSLMPRSSVFPKLSSSSRMIFATRIGSLRSSGNASPNRSTTTGTSCAKKPVLAPSIWRPYRTARRRIRRST
jgi:hypothetical protein